jgi:hypothetical protein
MLVQLKKVDGFPTGNGNFLVHKTDRRGHHGNGDRR